MNKSKINSFFRKFGFEVHGTGYIQSVLKQSFKEDAFKVQHDLVEEPQVIFDLGANRGNTVFNYLELFPNAKIYAFEPFPESFQALTEKYRFDSRVECFQIAISENQGVKTFYVNQNQDTNSLLKPTTTGLSSDRQVQNKSELNVETISLDLFCKEKQISGIDILKMDIQGGELGALKGAEQLLADKKIKLIFTETYFTQQYENQPLFHSISDFLYNYGFTLQDIYSPIYGKGNLAWADVIFKLKK
jgi:FkbM family methyltransferase